MRLFKKRHQKDEFDDPIVAPDSLLKTTLTSTSDTENDEELNNSLSESIHGFTQEMAEVHVSPKKGTRLVPLLLLTTLILCGSFCYIFSGFSDSEQIQEPETTTEDVRVYSDYFLVENGVLYFDPVLYTGEEILRIPSEISGVSVTAISDDCFRNCSAITMVEIASGIQEIGSGAFAECKNLRGFTVSDTVTKIGDEAFRGDTALEAIVILPSVQSIGTDCFTDCAKLHYIFFPGLHEAWVQLYSMQISPFTYISCYDGYFQQN